MPDREKVIKGLECCIKSDKEVFCPEDCPYDDDGDCRCETLVKMDALKLLKEQQKLIDEITTRRMNNGAFD